MGRLGLTDLCRPGEIALKKIAQNYFLFPKTGSFTGDDLDRGGLTDGPARPSQVY